MPYKDPKNNLENQRKHWPETYARNGEKIRARKRIAYWANPMKARKRSRIKRNAMIMAAKCVNCGKPRDRGTKVLCSVCAEVHKLKTKAVQLQVKIDTFNAYGGCFCACCGESHLVMLTLDHMDNKGAEHRKQLRGGKGASGGGGNKTYHALKKAGYPPGYRVLCFSCNHAYFVLGKCPHQTEREVNAAILAKTAFNLLGISKVQTVH